MIDPDGPHNRSCITPCVRSSATAKFPPAAKQRVYVFKVRSFRGFSSIEAMHTLRRLFVLQNIENWDQDRDAWYWDTVGRRDNIGAIGVAMAKMLPKGGGMEL
jgi:hypothetical protein